MTHHIWIALPPGRVPGRGATIFRIAAENRLKADHAVVLDGDGWNLYPQPSATLDEAISALDEGADGPNIGWYADGGEASLVIGAVSAGARRGLVLRFVHTDFIEVDSVLRGGMLEFLATLRAATAAREVMWSRELGVTTLVEYLYSPAPWLELPPGGGESIVALAGASDELMELMEIYGKETWAGGLRYLAQAWARPLWRRSSAP